MRIIVSGEFYNEAVDATFFDIPGSNERFAVHRALSADRSKGKWTATHVTTGLAIGRGDTSEAAIATARAVWASKSSEERAEAIMLGHVRQEMRSNRAGIIQ